MIILEDSWLYRAFLKSYGDFNKQIKGYLNTSFLAKYLMKLGNGLYHLSVRSMSIIILILVILNIIFCSMLICFEDAEIGLSGWIIRGILWFVGFAGIFCEANLKDLRESSLFLRWIDNNKQFLSEEK